MFLLDMFVIISSLVVEILLISNVAGVGASSGLLIIARTWRFARVGHGILSSQEQLEDIFIEEDSTIECMNDAWQRISDERWKDIKKHLDVEQTEEEITKDELQLARDVAKNPAVVLRALAFARSYKKMYDEKKTLKGALPGANMVGAQSGHVFKT